MAVLPEPQEVARRVRAALAYANIKGPELEERVGIKASTMARITSASTPRGVKSSDEIERIASACGVPVEFLVSGFAALESDEPDRVAALEDQVAHLNRQVLTQEQIESIVVSRVAAALASPGAIERPTDTRRGTAG